MSRSTEILCDWLNNLDKRYSPIRVFPQQLSNRQIGSSSNIKLRVQEGLNELGIVLLCTTDNTLYPQGDSGGPLISRKNSLSSYMLVGVVSGGTSKCGIGAPGIYTRVSNYRQWIVDNLL